MFSFLIISFIIIVAIIIIFIFLPDFLLKPFQNYFQIQCFHPTLRNSKSIFLTIDDSPTKNTNKILNVLKKYNVRCSFFIISNNFQSIQKDKHEQFCKRIKQISNDGHELCNHTSNKEASILLTKEQFQYSINHCNNSIHFLTGEYPRFCRPGSGFFNSTILKEITNKNLQLALGDVYPHDPIISNPHLIAFFIQLMVRPGSIIIIHDRPWTIPMLEILLPKLLKLNYQFLTLTEGFK